jgi:hypothetical protein
MIVGPTPNAAFGSCELSISLTKTPGETNLKLDTDIINSPLTTILVHK